MRYRALLLLALPIATLAPSIVRGIDHVPVAVADLERAGEQYRDLGFTLKPGRLHANGIRNLHAKFPDGTEIELITAPAATDALTRTYRDHLKNGDGPAFVALFSAPGVDAARRLKEQRVAVPPYVFFGPRQASPTDRPEHFAHSNTAYSVTRVWLAGDDLSAERRLLAALGAQVRRDRVELPDPIEAEIAEFPLGSVVLLPGRYRIVSGHPIVGITVAVRDLDVAARFAGAGERRASASVFVQPARALGYWLEFHR